MLLHIQACVKKECIAISFPRDLQSRVCPSCHPTAAPVCGKAKAFLPIVTLPHLCVTRGVTHESPPQCRVTHPASQRGAKVSRSKESPSEVMAARIISPEGRRRTEAAATVISTEVSYAVQVMPKYKEKIEPRGHGEAGGVAAIIMYQPHGARRHEVGPRQRQVPFRSWFNIRCIT